MGAAEPMILHSPGKLLALTVSGNDQASCSYALAFQDQPLLEKSTTGLKWRGKPGDWQVTWARESYDDTWQPVWGKRAEVRNTYNSLKAVFRNPQDELSFVTEFRLYDDALAIRYTFQGPDGRSIAIEQDMTSWNFVSDGAAYSYRMERRPRGPESLSSIKGRRAYPMTVALENGTHASILEAAIAGIGWIDLSSAAGDKRIQAELEAATVTVPFETPWRVLQVAEKMGTLIDSSTLANLNPPCAIEDPSWIKPGITFWDWRTWAYEADDGFVYNLDMPSWKRFIDCAARNGIPHLLLDAGWYGLEFDPKSDPFTSRDYLLYQKGNKPELFAKPAPENWEDPIDIPALIKYAKERNVLISLYINDKVNVNYDLEKVLETWASWGAAGIKYGFMKTRNRQEKVQKTNQIIRWCAEYKLLCNFHDGPVPPSGDYRTWPNCTTREYCHAQGDATRSFGPSDFLLTTCVNMLTGPIDTNCGMFDLNDAHVKRPKVFQPIPSTMTAECARILVTFSGQDILLDAPEEFEKHPELFAFITLQKQPWLESKTLSCEIGKSLVMMRRNAEHVFIGALTDEKARTLPCPLDFLEEGKWQAKIFEDAENTHFRRERETYQIRSRTVTNQDSLTLNLKPGGGACVLLTRLP